MKFRIHTGLAQRLLVFLTFALAQPGAAEVRVSVDIGWGGKARQGAWTPVFVTVADPKSRNASLELRAPHDSASAMRITQPIGIGPSDQTYVVYAPLINAWVEPVALQIRDADSGKLLYERALLDQSAEDSLFNPSTLFQTGSGAFIGVSGRGRAAEQLIDGGSTGVHVGFVRQAYLPRDGKGYDSLDTLVLNQPDFHGLELSQQNAIADWVRAGGRLVTWPGENPVPPGGPLVDLLPADIGEVTTVTVPPETLRDAGLADRFGTFKARVLSPRDGAAAVATLGPDVKAFRARRGLGSVTIVPFDASGLNFQTTPQARKFWSGLLETASNESSVTGRSGSYNTSHVQTPERAAAAAQVIDLLGDVPGVGTFGFTYVAMVLVGMMVVVGPVDWFVLRWLGRQPWTWVTTLGWIGLVTTVAVYMGSLFRSGDLHFRTLQVIDQADDAVVARTDVIGLYAAKSDDYRFEPTHGGWWEPMTADQMGFGRGSMRNIPFRQDGRSNLPEEMRVNVWNLRFLDGETIEKAPPVIAAALRREPPPADRPAGAFRLVGSVTNFSDSPLDHLWVRTKDGTADVARQPGWPAAGLAPKAAFVVDVVAINGNQHALWSLGPDYPRNPISSTRHITAPDDAPQLVARAGADLSPFRTGRIAQMLSASGADRCAVVYALSEHSPAAAKLPRFEPVQKHWQVIRAVVKLNP